jgi:methionine-rich copper-binding protein CopC
MSSSLLRLVVLLSGAVVVLLVGARSAGAHADLGSTDPENLSTVSSPVGEIRFTFTKPSEPVEERFSVEGPDGSVAIESVESLEGGTVVLLRLAEPADAGRYRVGWGIRAGDSHRRRRARRTRADERARRRRRTRRADRRRGRCWCWYRRRC